MYLRRTIVLLTTLLSLTLGGSVVANAKERQQLEALGVVNGKITTRSTLVEVTVFLSGQPLFAFTEAADAMPLRTLLIEQATLLSQDGNTLRLQQPLTLAQGAQGQWQLPVQVQVNGKVVRVSAQESSLGVRLTLPENAQRVTLVPVGAAQLTVPVSYRGDLSVALRIRGETEIEGEPL